MINELENEDTRLIEAEVLARKLLITQPDNPDAFNSLGLILIERARYLAAADQFLLAIERDPEREDLKMVVTMEKVLQLFQTERIIQEIS